MIQGEILLTGGSGTLGRAIIKRATDEKWDCKITVFSTDTIKHFKIQDKYPNIACVVGDVRDYTSLYNAMTGKDYVLHLAAVKHIPISEFNSIDTFEVNVTGTLNVAQIAMQLRTPHVLAISTDKAAHPANAYGATKMLTEKIFQEYSRLETKTQYHLLRYGNVMESTGSVVEVWRRAVNDGAAIKITDPSMTRFWLSPQQAVSMVVESIKKESGMIFIPKMASLSIGKLAEYTLEPGYKIKYVPLRPGEKMHETLLTLEEGAYAVETDDFFLLRPTTSERNEESVLPYSSDIAPTLSKKQLQALLENE